MSEGREALYGRNAVREALLAGRRRFYRLLLAKGVKRAGIVAQIIGMAQERQIPIAWVERAELDEIHPNHQGVAIETSPYPYVNWHEVLTETEERGEKPFLLLLDCIQDPQNLGSLLRTAEAVGVHGVVIPKRRAVGVTPAVVKASAGAVEHLLVARVVNLARTMEELKGKGVWMVGLENAPEALDYRKADLALPLALVVGSEGRGLSRLVREKCDFLIRLPMKGQVNSLNAAVAGSIALYEVWRRWERPP